MPMVEFSDVIDCDADRIWNVLKKFGELYKWHPAIVESGIENGEPDGMVGCVRKLVLQDGAIVRERLLSVDERNMSFSYRFEEAPLPLDNYVAIVKLTPLTGQAKAFINWCASFDVRESDPTGQYQELIRDLVVSGNESLKLYLSEASAS